MKTSNASSTAPVPGLSVSNLRVLDADPDEHEGFPRLVRAADGRLLLFSRLGTTHAQDSACIVLRTSSDQGETWSERREIWRDPAGWCAHNPVAVTSADGAVILWCSRYDWKTRSKNHGLVSRSQDHGDTWAPFRQFDASPYRTCYYMTDCICVDGRLLGLATCFQANGREPAFNVPWRSEDHGAAWTELPPVGAPDANTGNEVALAQLPDGRIISLLRGRGRPGLYRRYTADFGATWTDEKDIHDQVGTLQRPFLLSVGSGNWLLSGRQADRDPKATVAYLSTDDCVTFIGPTVIEEYASDGGYTSGVLRADGAVVLVYYADPGVPDKPDIRVVDLHVTGLNGPPSKADK